MVRAVIGCAIAVHRSIGPGFLERFYRKAMWLELSARDLQFETEMPVEVRYRGELLGVQRIDLVVEHLVIVELRAVEQLDPMHTRQLIAYVKATGLRAGVLINFNCDLLKYGIRRVVV